MNFKLFHTSLHTLAFFSDVSVAPMTDKGSRLKTKLTSVTIAKPSNKDGVIPNWIGGLISAEPSFVNGFRRLDPLAADKTLFSSGAKNIARYAGKLTEGTLPYPRRQLASCAISGAGVF